MKLSFSFHCMSIHRLNNTSMQNRYFATIDQLTDRHSHIVCHDSAGIQYFGSEWWHTGGSLCMTVRRRPPAAFKFSCRQCVTIACQIVSNFSNSKKLYIGEREHPCTRRKFHVHPHPDHPSPQTGMCYKYITRYIFNRIVYIYIYTYIYICMCLIHPFLQKSFPSPFRRVALAIHTEWHYVSLTIPAHLPMCYYYGNGDSIEVTRGLFFAACRRCNSSITVKFISTGESGAIYFPPGCRNVADAGFPSSASAGVTLSV